jgi:hypothetical protein
MSKEVTLDAPDLQETRLPQDKFEREFQAFHQLLPQLLRNYRGQYVAIHDGRVVASGQDKVGVALRAYAEHGNVPICVRLVAETPERFAIPQIRPQS